MRSLTFLAPALVVMGLSLAADKAQAGFVLEASLGRGMQLTPELDAGLGVTNLMIAPGYGLGEVIRLELGVVLDLPEGGVDSNFRLRPMLVIDPPIFPLYGRIVAGVANLTGDGDMVTELGGAVGVSMSLAGVGLFAEVGVIPQFVSGTRFTVLEGRAGGYYAF